MWIKPPKVNIFSDLSADSAVDGTQTDWLDKSVRPSAYMCVCDCVCDCVCVWESQSAKAPEVSLVLLDKGQVLVDVVRGADHKGHPLVEPLRLDVQHPLSAGGGEAPGLLNDEGDGVALVQQPQLWGENLKNHTSFNRIFQVFLGVDSSN